MLKTMFKPKREVAPLQLVQALTTVMQRWLPLELKNTRITPEEVWQVLSYASMNRQTLESACGALPQAASGNRLREVLLPALPSLVQLQGQLNRVLRQQLHWSLWKKPRPFEMAIDLVLIPYHGEPLAEKAEVLRGQAKAGTTHFHGYATVAIVHDRRRYTVAVMGVRLGQSMDVVVRQLLNRVKRLRLKVRRVYLDAGFCSVAVLKTLRRRRLPYLVPLPVRGKSGGVRTLCTGRKGYHGFYTLNSPTAGPLTVKVVVVRRYLKGRYSKHGAKWFAFVVAGVPRSMSPAQIFEWYRRRFGIETCYRQMNQVRARTTSRSPVLRLLLVGLAFIVTNLYVALRRAFTIPANRAPTTPALAVSLDRLALALRLAIEATLGSLGSWRCRQPLLIS